jgi:hypothetical protein
MSNEEIKQEIKKPLRTYRQRIIMSCCCILAIAAEIAPISTVHLED